MLCWAGLWRSGEWPCWGITGVGDDGPKGLQWGPWPWRGWGEPQIGLMTGTVTPVTVLQALSHSEVCPQNLQTSGLIRDLLWRHVIAVGCRRAFWDDTGRSSTVVQLPGKGTWHGRLGVWEHGILLFWGVKGPSHPWWSPETGQQAVVVGVVGVSRAG